MFIPKSNFYLKSISSIEPTLISLQLKFNGHRVVMSTGEKVTPSKWDFNQQRGVGRENQDLNFWLDKIEGEVKSIFRNFNVDNITPNTEIVLESLRAKLSNTPAQPIVVPAKVTLLSFIEKYNEEVKAIKKPETIKKHKTAFNHLKNYSELYKKPVDFENIDMDFYYSFSDYLAKDLGNAKNTVSGQIKMVKMYMREATDRGYNSNMIFQSKGFKKVTEAVDKIYLTKEEINRIYSLDLKATKTKELARDLLVVSCYTGLRFSDFTKITKDNIIDGKIQIRTTKTEQLIVIPIANIVLQILKKYNYHLASKISNQKMNLYLKDIGARAEINDDIVITKTIGGRRVEKTFKKYELISAHCGRRSFSHICTTS